MTAPIDWPSGFLAVSILLGEPPQASAAAVEGCNSAQSLSLLRDLSNPSRAVRARVVARVAAAIFATLDVGSA